MQRFGEFSINSIDENIIDSIPINTVKNHSFVWKQFIDFCKVRNYTLNGETSLENIANILKDWAFNMRRQNGEEYKEQTVKTIWNVTAKMCMEKYKTDYGISFNPFTQSEFKSARDAKNAKRRRLQTQPDKRKESSTFLKYNEFQNLVNHCNEDEPNGLQKKVFFIFSYELAWRGGEGCNCFLSYFKEERDNTGTKTGRIEYNPIFSKTTQGGERPCASSKWLVRNTKNPDICPIRLYGKFLLKRQNNKSERFFLTVNPNWMKSGHWYKNMPVGRNEIAKWTKTEAKNAGLDICSRKITNHSLRATAVSKLAKSGVGEQELIQITGHSSAKSIKSYIQMDQDHHQNIIERMRDNNSSSEAVQPQANMPSTSSMFLTESLATSHQNIIERVRDNNSSSEAIQPQANMPSSSSMSLTENLATSHQNHVVYYQNCTFNVDTFQS